jgi:hypothetical protein
LPITSAMRFSAPAGPECIVANNATTALTCTKKLRTMAPSLLTGMISGKPPVARVDAWLDRRCVKNAYGETGKSVTLGSPRQ